MRGGGAAQPHLTAPCKGAELSGGLLKLTEEQRERYSRHIFLPGMGSEGQKKLLNAGVLIIGMGGLGSPAALYLAAAGVGRLGIVDNGDVELSNLQRQIIHFGPDIGRAKVQSAEEKIKSINPDVKVIAHKKLVSENNAAEIMRDYDFVVEATDNFSSKLLINDACVCVGRAFSHAGILNYSGQLMTVIPGKSACLRCVFPEPFLSGDITDCARAGVFGAVAGVVGSIQAMEALKFILGVGDLLTDRLLVFDSLSIKFAETAVKKNRDCSVCGEKKKRKKEKDFLLTNID